jgi:hypothetical protein
MKINFFRASFLKEWFSPSLLQAFFDVLLPIPLLAAPVVLISSLTVD